MRYRWRKAEVVPINCETWVELDRNMRTSEQVECQSADRIRAPITPSSVSGRQRLIAHPGSLLEHAAQHQASIAHMHAAPCDDEVGGAGFVECHQVGIGMQGDAAFAG